MRTRHERGERSCVAVLCKRGEVVFWMIRSMMLGVMSDERLAVETEEIARTIDRQVAKRRHLSRQRFHIPCRMFKMDIVAESFMNLAVVGNAQGSQCRIPIIVKADNVEGVLVVKARRADSSHRRPRVLMK